MTALPATRQEALKLVEDMKAMPEDSEYGDIYDREPWDTLIALARRGADTVGATEAWASVHADDDKGAWRMDRDEVESITLQFKGRPVRRCLILPESDEE